jgi:hypothetical protein
MLSAIVSGVGAATTAVLIKLVLTPESDFQIMLEAECVTKYGSDTAICTQLNYLIRGASVLMIVVLNVLVLSAFVKGMKVSKQLQYSSSTSIPSHSSPPHHNSLRKKAASAEPR